MLRVKSTILKAAATLLISACLLVILPYDAPASNNEWPMFMKDQTHSSFARKAPAPPLSLKWKFKTDGAVYSSPVVYKGRVFAASYDKNLYALDADSGRLLWSFPTEGEILSTPAVSDGVVYFGSKDGKLYAVDAESGKERWSFETTGGIMTSPVVAEGLVFFGSSDLNFYALKTGTGKLAWNKNLPDYDIFGGIYASPAYWKGRVFAAAKNHAIYAFDAKTGKDEWTIITGSAVYASPAIKNGKLYITSLDRRLYAIDIKDKKVIWKKGLDNEMVYASTVATTDRIYVAFKNGRLGIYNRFSGRSLGGYTLDAPVSSTPVVSANGLLFVGCEDGYLYVLDSRATGIKWRYRTNAGIHSSPAVVEDAVYIGSKDGYVYAFGR